MHKKHSRAKKIITSTLLIGISFFAIVAGVLLVWIGSVGIPDFNSFEERKIERSTKILDNTGQITLYDVHADIKRTVVPFEDISDHLKKATVAIEDSNFYTHNGVQVKSFIRAALVNFFNGSFTQGGSTITQQIMKNTLLTKDKTIVRKIKEWILAIKIEKQLSKEEILGIYLNDNPYGGSVYGVEEGAMFFFGKHAKDITLAEAAYMAAVPKAPTFYSPYGKNRDKLEERKNLVLGRMKELGFITEEEYDTAKAEVVTFMPDNNTSIKAPHFVFFIRDYLEQKYGKDVVESGGLRVTTTLDWDLQQKAQEVAKTNALKNAKEFNATNTGVVVLDPRTGQILSMVGSRDYFDKEIDGNFNIATTKRQPGSSFKPFVYATAFKEGYTPETTLFDVPTEFNASCSPSGGGSNCYMPDNYNGQFHGPMKLRDALAQSINIPAVKLLYLVGVNDALKTAKDMGIKSLEEASRYGLTLVLGGGEVSLLDMASAYGVFANEGMRVEPTGILRIEDDMGNVIEEYSQKENEVLTKNVALTISDILSDNSARTPTFGANSTLFIPGRDVAVKTGTTNSNRDAWMVGYSPSVVVAVWSGNNDNTPMKKGSTVSGPTFNEIMRYALKDKPLEYFEEPTRPENYASLPPVLRGYWQGGESYVIDSFSGGLATENTPDEAKEEKIVGNIHSILYWIDKNNPTVRKTPGPSDDSQYKNWETAVQNWTRSHPGYGGVSVVGAGYQPSSQDTIHTEENKPKISIKLPEGDGPYLSSDDLNINVDSTGHYPLKKVDIYINGIYINSTSNSPFSFSVDLSTLENLSNNNELRIIGTDSVYNKGEKTVTFEVKE